MTAIGRWSGVAAALVLAAGVAVAQDRSSGTEGVPGRSPSGQAGTSSPGPSGVGGSAAAMPAECEHKVMGTVKHLDPATGTVSIDIKGADDIELKLPADELAGFEAGDQVVVSMGMRESRVGAEPDRGTEDR